MNDMKEINVMSVLRGTMYILKEIALVRYIQDQALNELSNDHIYICVADGWGEMDIGSRQIPLDYGKTVHIQPGQLVVVRSSPEQYPLQVYRMVVEKLELMESSASHRMFRKTGLPGAETDEMPMMSPNRLLQMLQELEQLWAGDRNLGEAVLEYRFRELLLELYDRNADSSAAPRQDKLGQVISHLQEHYANRITRDDMARKLGMNADYFSVWFKKAAGRGFSAYMNQLRIDRAKELLLAPGQAIQEVAEIAGFVDAFYFSRKFKEMTGRVNLHPLTL